MEKNLVYVVERRDRANPVGLQLIQPLGIRVFLIDRRKFFSWTSYAGKLLMLVRNTIDGYIRYLLSFLLFFALLYILYNLIYYNLNTLLKYIIFSNFISMKKYNLFLINTFKFWMENLSIKFLFRYEILSRLIKWKPYAKNII